jgi:8-oxo-dGTP pyrophosphatase MutT (NUDIX family)
VVKRSAGLLLYRHRQGELEVLLGHPGGPFFSRKDDGVWTIPKGEVDPGEDELAAAHLEFTEEIGVAPSDGDPLPLGETMRAKARSPSAGRGRRPRHHREHLQPVRDGVPAAVGPEAGRVYPSLNTSSVSSEVCARLRTPCS